MPAFMHILGWKVKGLRCPDHEVNCCNSIGEPYPITLIQMPNGTGKTTTLQLLRLALSGGATDANWSREKTQEFKKRNSNITDGYFELTLLLNDRRATVSMSFDFENSHVTYKTTYGQGQRDGFHPPSDFRRFMNENFVNFYVFDGELAKNLLNRQHTDAEIVVEYLFQMNAFDSLCRKIENHWESKIQKGSAKEERGLSRRQNRLKNLQARLKMLRAEQKTKNEKLRQIQAELESKEARYNQEIGKEKVRSEKLELATTEVDRLKEKVRENALSLLDSMRDPHALSMDFANAMLALKSGLDRVKLPESAAKEFFEDLALESECVCGRPIDDEIKEIIRNRANKYLGSDDVSLLNSMKTDIKDNIGEDPQIVEVKLNNKINDLKVIVIDQKRALNELDELRLEVEHNDPAVKEARDHIEELKPQVRELETDLERYDSKEQLLNDDQTFGIEVIEKRIKEAENLVAEITNTIILKEKRDILRKIVKLAHEKARIGITSEICNDANQRINELMPHNQIIIDRIDRCLVLQGREGGSSGETLSVAYAFLATLFHRSEQQLPFVVDSPAGPIDLAVRPKIGEIIPKLTGQFIAFTISSEREGFLMPLKQASINKNIEFITLFRKGAVEFKDTISNNVDVVETVDCYCVRGESFFKGFQLDSEEVA